MLTVYTGLRLYHLCQVRASNPGTLFLTRQGAVDRRYQLVQTFKDAVYLHPRRRSDAGGLSIDVEAMEDEITLERYLRVLEISSPDDQEEAPILQRPQDLVLERYPKQALGPVAFILEAALSGGDQLSISDNWEKQMRQAEI